MNNFNIFDIFRMPDEVLDKMDSDDEWNQSHYDQIEVAFLNKQLCPHCGFPGLVLAETPHGQRLVYGRDAKVKHILTGKIHYCDPTDLKLHRQNLNK